MANCEKCGATFTPSAERTEVTSLRVLCQKCEEERRAEKSARATATTAAPAPAAAKPAARPSAPAGTNSTPAAARPAAAPPSPAAPAARPAARPGTAARAAATPAPERRAASSPPASRTARASRDGTPAKEMHGAPTKKLLHRPISGRTGGAHEEGFHPDVRREVEMLKQREGKVMTIAWIICGVLVLTAGAVALTAKNKHDNEIKAEQDHRNALDTFLEACRKFDLTTEDGCKQLITFTNEKKSLGWEDDPKVGGEAAGLVSKAKANQESIADKKAEFDRLANIEGILKEASSKSPDELLKARRTLESLVGKGDAYGDEFKKRVMDQMKIVDRTVLSRLRDEAKTLAGGGTDKMRAALTAYSKAEDEATKLLDKAMSAKEEETKSYFTTQFKELFEESNKFVEGVFTQDVIDKTPWTDLLSADQQKHWQNYGFQGFRLESGKLEAVGPAPGAGVYALMAVPDAGGFRDFDLEMEFTLKGIADVGFRVLKRFDQTVEAYTLSTTGQEPLKVGQTYTLHATYIGNHLTGTLNPGDSTLATVDSSWTKQRKGALAVQVHEAAEFKISKLRIRELRSF